MAFPEFDPGKRKLLFFSRGRGRGHAVPDVEIVRELLKLRDDVDVRFVSYGTGATAIGELGFSVIDLGLPDDNGFSDTLVLAGQVIGWLGPDLVVAHEEFAALPAAKIFDRETLFLTDWFIEAGDLRMDLLRFANRILFLDDPGIYEEPPCVQERVDYLGPIVRAFQYGRQDRAKARQELGIPQDAFVAGIFPGSHPEQREPIIDLVIEAVSRLPQARLHWVGGPDADLMHQLAAKHENLHFCPLSRQIDRDYVACDVAITKANRKSVLELEVLGIRSVSLTHRYNRIDDRRAATFQNTKLLDAKTTTPEELASLLVSQAADGPAPSTIQPGAAATAAAARIAQRMDASGIKAAAASQNP
jgi:hypothetical protein